MSEFWAYVERLERPGPIALQPDEARHVAARRSRIGDALVVFDGRGRTATARIEALGKHTTSVTVEAISESERPAEKFVLASAIPKGDRLSTQLQMLSQLGLDAWQPLILQDSAVRTLDPTAARLVRILIESCKVARRAWRLDVRTPCSLEAALARVPEDVSIYFGDREGATTGLDSRAAWVAIGPEAGFSDAERAALRKAGGRSRSFGAHNLRIETATVAATVAFHLAQGSNLHNDAGE